MLLDVNNVYVNSRNHGFDPKEYIASLPLDRVVQIHVAGHDIFESEVVEYIDTHGQPVCEDVWTLLEWVMQHCKPCGLMIEQDNNFPPFSEVMLEIERCQTIWNKTQGSLSTNYTSRDMELVQ